MHTHAFIYFIHSSKSGPSINLLAILALQRDPLVRNRIAAYQDYFSVTILFKICVSRAPIHCCTATLVCKYVNLLILDIKTRCTHLFVHNREPLSNTCRFCSLFCFNLFHLEKKKKRKQHTPSVPALATPIQGRNKNSSGLSEKIFEIKRLNPQVATPRKQ